MRVLERLAELVTVAIVVIAAGSCESDGYRKATVIKMSVVFTPDNLSDDPTCRGLWRSIEHLGVTMDEGRRDWNQVILSAAYDLIQRGCVKPPSATGTETRAGFERKRGAIIKALRVLQAGLEPARDLSGHFIRDGDGKPLRPIDGLTDHVHHAMLTDVAFVGPIFGAGGTLGLPPFAPSFSYRAKHGDALAASLVTYLDALSAALDDVNEVWPLGRSRRDVCPDRGDTRGAAEAKIRIAQEQLRVFAHEWLDGSP